MDSKNTEQIAENKMGVMPVKKLVWNMSFPMMVSMLVQALYNIVDSIFVARLSEDALTAVSLAFPLQTLVIAVGAGTGVGVNAILSRSLGEKNFEKANATALNGGFLYIMSYLLFLVLGFVAVEPFYVSQLGGSSPEIFDMGVQYLRIVMIFSMGIFGQFFFERLLTSTGKTVFSMVSQLSGAITNIILDPILIFGLLGMPKMGVAGAAIATICSQALSAALVILVLVRVKDMHRLDLHRIRTDRKMLHRIIRIGFPAGLQSVMYSLSNIIIQTAINGLGTDTVAAWTVYGKIDALFWMTVSSFGIAITTFAGQNYGAGKGDRVRKGIRSCLLMCFASTILISVLLRLGGHIIYGLFTSDPEVMRIGMQIVHFLVPTFITYVCVEVISGALRGVGDCWIPTLICLSGICLIRILWIMLAVPLRPDVYTVTFSYPLTWTITSIFFILYYCFFSKIRIFRPRPERMSDLA